MGVLNHIYEFFYNWLFGTGGAISALSPFSNEITIFFSIAVVSALVWFCWKIVSYIFKSIASAGRW